MDYLTVVFSHNEHRLLEIPAVRFNTKITFLGLGIPIIKIRRSHDRLIFIMGIPILRKYIFTIKIVWSHFMMEIPILVRHLYTGTDPWPLYTSSTYGTWPPVSGQGDGLVVVLSVLTADHSTASTPCGTPLPWRTPYTWRGTAHASVPVRILWGAVFFLRDADLIDPNFWATS